jgi:hypothetical protein
LILSDAAQKGWRANAMVDWHDFCSTAGTWASAAATGETLAWDVAAVARAEHTRLWARYGGCVVCRRPFVFSPRPPFCEACRAGRLVRLADSQAARLAGIVPVHCVGGRGTLCGLLFDRREAGGLAAAAPLVRAACPNRACGEDAADDADT